MGGAAGAVAAAAARRAEQRIIEILRAAEATSAAKPAPLHPRRMIERSVLRRLLRSGAVVEAGAETFWLNETAYEAYRRSRQQLGLMILAGVLVFVVGLIGAAAFARMR